MPFTNDCEDDFDPDPFGYERGCRAHTQKRRQRPQVKSDEDPEPLVGPAQHQASDKGDRHFDRSVANPEADSSAPGVDGAVLDLAGKHKFFSVADPWFDTQRAAPRELLQFGVFGTQRRGRQRLVHERMDSNANVRLEVVTGETLFQLDLETWMSAIHLGRHGGPIRASRRRLLTLWGRARGGNGETNLRMSLERLSKYQIKLEVENKRSRSCPEKEPDRYSYEGLLIDVVIWNGSDLLRGIDDGVEITLNPSMSVLFEPLRRTLFLASTRAAIGDNPVALWMYGVIRSHRDLLPRPVAYYHRMCGSRSCVSDFTHQLKRALSLLAKEQLLFSAEIRGGRLFVQRDRPSVPSTLPREDTVWFIKSTLTKSRGSQ